MNPKTAVNKLINIIAAGIIQSLLEVFIDFFFTIQDYQILNRESNCLIISGTFREGFF